MNAFHKLILGAYSPDNDKEYQMVKGLAITLILLIPLLAAVLFFGKFITAAAFVMKGIIALLVLALILIRAGFYKNSISLLIVCSNLLIPLFVFSWPNTDPYQIYMLTTFFLFLLFISTLITYNTVFAYITMVISAVSVVLHYITRSIPYYDTLITRNLDDYSACLGLLIISFFILVTTLKHKQALFKTVEEEAARNFERARQLESAYESMMASLQGIEKTEATKVFTKAD